MKNITLNIAEVTVGDAISIKNIDINLGATLDEVIDKIVIVDDIDGFDCCDVECEDDCDCDCDLNTSALNTFISLIQDACK